MSNRPQSRSFFDPERSAESVIARIGPECDGRVRQIMESLVRHLHAMTREVGLTTEEWAAAIRFLTQTGQKCSDWRQEFILLSDVLGLSMLVDSINHQRPAEATQNTVLGPFHVADAPRLPLGANISLDGKGEPLLVRGRVLDIEGAPIKGATLDVWQANHEGFYDVQQRGIQPDWNLRGRFETDAEGRYWFRGAKPRWYPIPHDGPVGHLLAALDRHPNRAAHLHFIVEAPGYQTAVTHIFTPDCPYLSQDAVFGVKQSLIAQFDLSSDPLKAASLGLKAPFWEVEWNFVLVSNAKADVGAHGDPGHPA